MSRNCRKCECRCKSNVPMRTAVRRIFQNNNCGDVPNRPALVTFPPRIVVARTMVTGFGNINALNNQARYNPGASWSYPTANYTPGIVG